jgi:hypothetical protein
MGYEFRVFAVIMGHLGKCRGDSTIEMSYATTRFRLDDILHHTLLMR